MCGQRITILNQGNTNGNRRRRTTGAIYHHELNWGIEQDVLVLRMYYSPQDMYRCKARLCVHVGHTFNVHTLQ